MTILGRSEELVSRCVECDLAEPESLASLGGSAPGVVDGILSWWAAHVAMSNPGSSWLSMPVTETVLPVLSNIHTSEPARPPLAPLSIRDP